MAYKTIGILGDSISQGFFSSKNNGWFNIYLNKLNDKKPYGYAHQNMAVGGDRITDIYHRLNSEAMSKYIDILFISVGVNDLIRWNNESTQTDTSEGLRNEFWNKIISTASKNFKEIYIFSLLPVIESRHPSLGYFNRKFYILNEDIEKYNEFLQKTCNNNNIKFIDITKAWNNHNLEDLLFDSTHPNDKGHELIANFLEREGLIK